MHTGLSIRSSYFATSVKKRCVLSSSSIIDTLLMLGRDIMGGASRDTALLRRLEELKHILTLYEFIESQLFSWKREVDLGHV